MRPAAASDRGSMKGTSCSRLVVVVETDGRRYGLAADHVARVVRMVKVTPLAGSPVVVHGVIDVAGAIVPVVDPRVRFHHGRRAPQSNDQLVIARAGARTVAVWVDRAVGLTEVDDFEPVPVEVSGGSHVAGVSRTADGLLVITDLDAFLSLDEESALDAALAAQ